MSETANDLYLALRKLLLLTAALLALLWFLFEIREVILLFLFAASIAIIINNPVTWLEQKGLHRVAATILVFGGLAAMLGLLSWFLIPRLVADLTTLVLNLPEYADNLRDWVLNLFSNYPGLRQDLGLEANLPQAGLSFVGLILRPLGRYSFSLLGWLAIIIFLLSVILYMVAYPVPLLETYQHLLPQRWREPGTRAFVRASTMIVGWLRANLIAGFLEALTASIFLSYMNVPGALVWGALAFFAELVPRLGLYLMSLPPTLVALSVDPIMAVWVLLFYIALDQIVNNLVLPRVQKQTMNLHPVLILFTILALAAAFGIVGALLATPLAAITKAYYQTFYLERQPPDSQVHDRVRRMLRLDPPPSPDA